MCSSSFTHRYLSLIASPFPIFDCGLLPCSSCRTSRPQRARWWFWSAGSVEALPSRSNGTGRGTRFWTHPISGFYKKVRHFQAWRSLVTFRRVLTDSLRFFSPLLRWLNTSEPRSAAEAGTLPQALAATFMFNTSRLNKQWTGSFVWGFNLDFVMTTLYRCSQKGVPSINNVKSHISHLYDSMFNSGCESERHPQTSVCLSASLSSTLCSSDSSVYLR